ncbi:hypothetical protein [Amycolatopsis taiwanensis]|uniref:PPE family domain-containing protein n=1 Tax=Amycolatopsis taiwanensis TaxID=342230 RepID=A0A9W6R4R1_9PSEU|nr:hypothetical protein [Amycolatopsis taiwanensis]GLY68578.1 hypothetical protein Atai01_51970 [Amycolatopsis taiwanensis]
MEYTSDPRPSRQPNTQSDVPLGDNGESDALVRQARNSAGGFDYGSDRVIGNPPNWASQQSDQLYRGATQNNDPASAEATGQLWRSHGEELHQAANDLYNAISELGNVWVGRGAGSAQGALVGIANSSKQAGDAAHTMSSRLAQQAAAAAEVKKMPAPKDFDPAQQTAAMLAGGPAAMVADMKKQADEADAVHAQQVQYFNAYTQAMSEVDGTTPSFGPDSLGLPASGSISVTRASSVGGVSGVVGAYGAGSAGPIGVGYAGGDVAGGHGAAPGALGGQFGGAGQPGVPGAAGAPAAAHGGPAAAHGTHGASPVPTSSAGGGGSSALGIGLGVAGAGLAAVAGKAVLGRGNKSGAKKAADATDAASVQEAEQLHGPAQNQPLMNAQGTIGNAQNTPPPAAGMGGMGGMAGGQREEDKEHTRASFLIEADPDAAFGAGTATPPPVIGAWDDED